MHRRPGLVKGATPSILPNCPSYFQQIIVKPSRLDFDKKEITQLKEVLEESSLQHELEIEEFGVKTLSDITLKLKNINMPDNWLLWSPTNSTLHILQPSLSQECMQIESYLTIDDLCITRAFVRNTQIPLSISKLVDVRQVFQLIEKLSKYYSDSVYMSVSATTHLSYPINQIEENEEVSSTVESDLLPLEHSFIASFKMFLFLKPVGSTMW